MVPDKLITADCHITPPLSIVNELPEHYREYFPRIEKDENGNDYYDHDKLMPFKLDYISCEFLGDHQTFRNLAGIARVPEVGQWLILPKAPTTKGTKVHKAKAIEFKNFVALCVVRGSEFLRAHDQSGPLPEMAVAASGRRFQGNIENRRD